MTFENLQQAVRGSRPFSVRMVSGKVINVPHPDFVALSPSGTSMILVKEKSLVEFVRINQIESLEIVDREG